MKLQEQLTRIKEVMSFLLEIEETYDAVLVGGLDYRPGDKNINQQVSLLKQGLGSDKKIKGFRYNVDNSELIAFMRKNPKIPVFLFSAGCAKAETLSLSPFVDKDKLYIIEPYAASEKTKKIVNNAVSNGVPPENVYVGTTVGRGLGIVKYASSSNTRSHWGALEKVGSSKSDYESSDNGETVKDDSIISKEFIKSSIFNPEVEKLQNILISKGYNIGSFGPNKDGVDGKYGNRTKAAQMALINNIPPSVFNSTYKNKPSEKSSKIGETSENIVIGDSQTPHIARQTNKADLISDTPGERSLWQGSKRLSWLLNAVSNYPIDKKVKNVIISIGTNGGFNKGDNIAGLVSELEGTFPNAKIFVVKGSWGWGGVAKKTEKDVNEYYDIFSNLGVEVIPTPIGNIEPHGNRPVYRIIGSEIDSMIK